MREKKIGLVLSGGGVRGVAHVGVIKAMEEKGIKPSVIAGCSAGAIVGALYAGGYTAEEMFRFFDHTAIFQLKNYTIRKPALIDTSRFIQHFEKHLPKKTFASLEIPLYINATDMLSGELTVFSSGDLVQPVLASAAVPGLFSPVEIDGKWYSDGGILNNMPAFVIREKCDFLIGVDVNPVKKITGKEMNNIFEVISRALFLAIRAQYKINHKLCDLLIYPEETAKYGWFSMDKLKALYDIGYREGQYKLDSIKS